MGGGGGFRTSWCQFWGPSYKGTRLFGDLYEGSLMFLNPHITWALKFIPDPGKGSEVWGLSLYGVYKRYLRGTL